MKIIFETEPCTRCGGCGEFSYCQKYGTTCFKCHGSGKQLTRRGKSALQKIRAFMAENFNKPVSNLRKGDVVRMTAADKWRTVLDAPTPDNLNPGRVTVPLKGINHGAFETSVIEVRPTAKQFDELVVPYARRFKGAKIVETEDA